MFFAGVGSRHPLTTPKPSPVCVPTVIQFARLSGFSPIITTASLRNAPLLESLGATHVLDRTLSSEQLIAEAKKLAGGPFDVVYDAISHPETLGVAYPLTAQGGSLVVVLPAEEQVGKAKEDEKRVLLAQGLFVAPVNREIGRTLLDTLPSLLESGEIKVSMSSWSLRCHAAFADTCLAILALVLTPVRTAEPRGDPARGPQWGRRWAGALEEQPSQRREVGGSPRRHGLKGVIDL